ncbi:tryptophan synthase alpha chain [Nocardiopsis mwathae]|uniref:Tryptophan synthase alpha chain n=1 Tax=Nocardiopsis mwathae TaxID=1472723 RepID=A0A7W9YLV8_9ACTN|nr:tryptophan synthase subunit alpha [Nocardiopsis mwathae]MBB6174549.1 tryptophan synthase alpha chain [Nocardiopsis mwathae]
MTAAPTEERMLRGAERPAPGHDLAARLRRDDGGVSLVPYLMAGHTGPDATRDIGRRLAHSGIAALELGIPHSDPLADGPVIQRAGQRALDAGTTTEGCLRLAADIAAEDAAPVVLMTYVNPVLAYGVRRFVRDAAEAGVAAVIVPDLPMEEAPDLDGALAERGVASVRLVAPTSTDDRVAAACAAATGFVYTVTVAGITGSRGDLPDCVERTLARVRARTHLPVAAGFGISRPEHLRRLRGHADAAIVGSSLVAEIDAGRDPYPMVKELLSSCR